MASRPRRRTKHAKGYSRGVIRTCSARCGRHARCGQRHDGALGSRYRERRIAPAFAIAQTPSDWEAGRHAPSPLGCRSPTSRGCYRWHSVAALLVRQSGKSRGAARPMPFGTGRRVRNQPMSSLAANAYVTCGFSVLGFGPLEICRFRRGVLVGTTSCGSEGKVSALVVAVRSASRQIKLSRLVRHSVGAPRPPAPWSGEDAVRRRPAGDSGAGVGAAEADVGGRVRAHWG